MNAPKEHEALSRRAKACFDDSVERLDATTQSRLHRARQAALAGRDRGRLRTWRVGYAWLPVAGLVAGAAVVALLVRAPAPEALPVADPAEVDADVLFGEDQLEMLENLEFYYWMDEVDGRSARHQG